MDGDEVRALNQIGALDRARAKPQMRNRHRAGLLRVVHKVALRIIRRLFADDLDRVLVGADGSIRAQPPEHRSDFVIGFGVKAHVVGQAGETEVIDDADSKMVLGPVFFQLVEHAFDHRRRELF